jgi:threonine synthase
MWKGVIREYPEFYRFDNEEHIVTLLEGGTPLIPVPRLSAAINPEISLFVKYEGLNPTSSFKDRGMTLAQMAFPACVRAPCLGYREPMTRVTG